MKITLNQRPAGIALIIVMIAVISLSILAGMYAYSMKVEARLAMNSNNDAELEWMGRSGVEVAKYVLGLEMQAGGVDSLESFWAGGPGSPALSNSPLMGFSMKNIPLGNGTVTVEPMIDLERKANINMADDTILEQALIEMGVDAGQYPTIVNSIHDWIDPDDATRIDGAESDYYQTYDPPFEAKNGPIDDLSELLLVKGIDENPDLYWGPSAGGQAPSRVRKDSRTRLGFHADVPVYPVGLVDLFTPISSGKININTASAAVLQLIPGVDERAAQEISRLRMGPDGVTPIPLNNPGEAVNAGLPQQVVQQIARYTDVRSRTFEVHINAEIKGYVRKFTAIVVRNNPRDIQVLSFHSVE
jgi:general secretion pathway protein K